jgi:hypothetical protein
LPLQAPSVKASTWVFVSAVSASLFATAGEGSLLVEFTIVPETLTEREKGAQSRP